MNIGPKHAAIGMGRVFVSGSTRFTADRSKAKAPRAKTFGIRLGTTLLGSNAGGYAGSMIAGSKGRMVGAAVGGYAGSVAGRKYAVDRGWQRKTKDRMSVRAYHSIFHSTHQSVAAHSRR